MKEEERQRNKNNSLTTVIRHGGIYIIIFVIAVITGVLLLVASTGIKRERIRRHMEESAYFLCENEVFFSLAEDIPCSKIDRYADSILLSIAWHMDEADPLESVMLCSFYEDTRQNENENFRQSLEMDLPANQQYLRYWHGSAALIRFMHQYMSLKNIYHFFAGLLIILMICLGAILLRHRYYIELIGSLIAMAAVSVWFVPFSLEYIWIFLITLLLSVIGVILAARRRDFACGILLFAGGIWTAYLDFLTAETLTLLFPLLLILHIRNRTLKDDSHSFRRLTVRACSLWAVGYAGMWISKWVLASIISGENTMPYVWGHVAERIGDDQRRNLFETMAGAMQKNVGCIFPLGYGLAGGIAFVILVIVLLYYSYVYHKKADDKEMVALYGALAAIPYIRYIALRNHSYLHYFFTYRAQAATVLALCFIIYETSWLGKKKRR